MAEKHCCFWAYRKKVLARAWADTKPAIFDRAVAAAETIGALAIGIWLRNETGVAFVGIAAAVGVFLAVGSVVFLYQWLWAPVRHYSEAKKAYEKQLAEQERRFAAKTSRLEEHTAALKGDLDRLKVVEVKINDNLMFTHFSLSHSPHPSIRVPKVPEHSTLRFEIRLCFINHSDNERTVLSADLSDIKLVSPTETQERDALKIEHVVLRLENDPTPLEQFSIPGQKQSERFRLEGWISMSLRLGEKIDKNWAVKCRFRILGQPHLWEVIDFGEHRLRRPNELPSQQAAEKPSA